VPRVAGRRRCLGDELVAGQRLGALAPRLRELQVDERPLGVPHVGVEQRGGHLVEPVRRRFDLQRGGEPPMEPEGNSL
jgi:hypothetical protein